jgi:hypothetical protein
MKVGISGDTYVFKYFLFISCISLCLVNILDWSLFKDSKHILSVKAEYMDLGIDSRGATPYLQESKH